MKKASETVQMYIDKVHGDHEIFSKNEVLQVLVGLKEVLVEAENQPEVKLESIQPDNAKFTQYLEKLQREVEKTISDYDYEDDIDLDLDGRELFANFNSGTLEADCHSTIQDVTEDFFPEYFGIKAEN